ncbi:MAG: DNA-processing protein DprA [Aquificota bacterium]|nr:DNA-processing protein DprA [Aquificota bacterium]
MVDARVHTATLERGGYTVCVLGSGLLRAKGDLYGRILSSGGLLLSEFPPDEPPSKHTFPRRNRIIAGLSEFLIVPEAGRKSGSLITARHTHRYRREVFVHTGPGGERWEGCSWARQGRSGKGFFSTGGHIRWAGV